MENIHTIIFSALGLLLSGGALINIISTIRFLRNAKTTSGTVVGFQTKRIMMGRHRRRERTVYLPTIEYAPAEIRFEKTRITATVGSHPPAYNIGETVTVYFLPTNPRGGRLNSFWELWAFPLIIFVVGCFICLLAYIIWANQLRH